MTCAKVQRPKHQYPDWEQLLQVIERHHWEVAKPGPHSYFRCRCPCGVHSKRVTLTPSKRQSLMNLRKWFERQPCWEDV